MTKLSSQFQDLDQLIRSGKFLEAKKKLLGMHLSRTTATEDRVTCASLWKRIGEPFRAIKVLGSMEKLELKSRGDRLRWLEYADCLLKINASGGAGRILSRKDLETETGHFLVKAFHHIHSWDYQNALKVLRIYLQRQDPENYFYFVAKVNELACLAFLELGREARIEAEGLLPELKRRGFERLRGNSTEILMQVILQNIAPEERRRLEDLIRNHSKISLEDTAMLDNVHLRKWSLYHKLSENQDEAVKGLQTLRDQASSNGLSEVVRDVDRTLARVTGDEELENFVFFGTPYPAFLARFNIRNITSPIHIDIAKDTGLITRPGGTKLRVKKKNIFNVESICQELDYSLTCKVLIAILRDFYRAPTTVEIFDCVYPAEYFHPVTSLKKVNQLVFRLNEQLLGAGYPFIVAQRKAGYHIEASENLTLVLSEPASRTLQISDEDHLAGKLKKLVPNKFTLQEFLEQTGYKRRTAQLVLKNLIDRELIVRQGRTTKTFYTWAQNENRPG